MYRSPFGDDPFARLDRLQRCMQEGLDATSPGIRGPAGGFPAIDVGRTTGSTAIHAFVPGVEPSRLEVTVERGARAGAEVSQGVLCVRIPRSEHARPRRVEVAAA